MHQIHARALLAACVSVVDVARISVQILLLLIVQHAKDTYKRYIKEKIYSSSRRYEYIGRYGTGVVCSR
jgi:hypothetical protein